MIEQLAVNRWRADLGCEHEQLEVELTDKGGLEIFICGSVFRISLADLRVALEFVAPDHSHISRYAASMLREIMAEKPRVRADD